MDTINQAAIESTDNTYWIEQAEALELLKKDPNFIKVISEGYFKEKAVRGTSLLATDYVKANGVRTDVMEGLIAISALEDHFKVIETMGGIAKQNVSGELDEDAEE